MNQTKRFLAPASLALSIYCSKIYLQAISYHHFNLVAKALLISPKSSPEICHKSNIFMDNSDCKILPEIVNIATLDDKEEINQFLQKMHVSDTVNEKVNGLEDKLNDKCKESFINTRSSKEEKKFKDIRRWKKISSDDTNDNLEEPFIFKLLSFNILAQSLLESHFHLYRNHDRQALPWEKRKPLIIQEILKSEAHVVCLQEMQENHLEDFLKPFQEIGFNYLYKKRTNNKTDGLLLMYREDKFDLLEFSKVELYQTGIELLNRDNVGIIAKFSLKKNPEIKFVIATTHLLFNPRRNDVRLGQVQLLFAEIERIAFINNTDMGPRYLPIVISGDFNLTPHTGVYRFITEGSIEFVGKGRNLEKNDYRFLSNSLIPPHLYVTDDCQHFHVLSKRLSGEGDGKVMLRNTEDTNIVNNEEIFSTKLVDLTTTTYQKVEIADGHYVTFSSGLLTHPFRLKSLYNHSDQKGNNEATTFQDQWVTVDYIFYSNMQPLEKYTLPTVENCIEFLPTIPNSIVGSDHFCLGATFLLNKR